MVPCRPNLLVIRKANIDPIVVPRGVPLAKNKNNQQYIMLEEIQVTKKLVVF